MYKALGLISSTEKKKRKEGRKEGTFGKGQARGLFETPKHI
jgi:hypothetical protein